MDQPKIHANDRIRWRMLAYLSIALVFSWSTWFSATAGIPQLRDIWAMLRLKFSPEVAKIAGGKG